MITKLSFKKSITAGALAAVAAAAVNVLLFFVLKAAGVFVDTIFLQPNQPLTVLAVLIASIVPTLIASVVFFLIEKFTNNGFKIFTIVSVVLLLLSFMNPFMGIPNVTISFALGLNLMHVVVVLALLIFIGKAHKQNA